MSSRVNLARIAMDQLASLKPNNPNDFAKSDIRLPFTDMEFVWLNVFRRMSIEEKIRLRRVCRQFRRLSLIETCHLSLSVRTPLPVAENYNKVIPYHQLLGPSTADGRPPVKHPVHVDTMLVWKNEIKLIFALPFLFQNLKSLRLVSESESYPGWKCSIPVENLVRLVHLEHLQLYGDGFFLENWKGYQLRLRRLDIAPVNASLRNGGHWINDLAFLCPSLATLKCCPSCLEFLSKPLLNVSKYHVTSGRFFDEKHFGPITKYLPRIEKIYFPIPPELTSLKPLTEPLPSLTRIHLHYYYKRLDDYLDICPYEVLKTDLPKLLQALQGIDLDMINVQVNGFRLRQLLDESSLDSLMLFLRSQSWNAEAVSNFDFDRYRADKVRSQELRRISFQSKLFANPSLFSSHRLLMECFVYGKSSPPLLLSQFKQLPFLFPSITFLSIDVPTLGENVRFDLRVLLQMKNLRRCNLFRVICSHPECLIKIIRTLPFLENFNIHEVKLENRMLKKLLLVAKEKSLLHPQILYQVAGNGRVFYQFTDPNHVFTMMPHLRQTLVQRKLEQLR